MISVLVFIVVTFGVQVRWLPKFHDIDIDSGVYSYAGTRILEGELPYRDFWDHKPPGIYYLNALAFKLFGITPWALWWLGLVWITTIVVLLFSLMYKLVGWEVASIATFFFVLTLHHPNIYKGGNFTEIYALLPQVLIIWCTLIFLTSSNNRWNFLLGVFTAIAFLFKQTTIAISISSISVILFKDFRLRQASHLFRRLLLFIAGGFIPILIVIVYWQAHDALNELLEAVIEYNLLYSQGGLSVRSIYASIRELAIPQPFAALFELSCVAVMVFIFKNWPRFSFRIPSAPYANERATVLKEGKGLDWRELIFASVLIAFPIEIIMSSISGRTYGHYLITPLLVLVIASAYLFYVVKTNFHDWSFSDLRTVISITMLATLIFPWFLEVYGWVRPKKAHILELKAIFSLDDYLLDEVNEYVIGASDPDQSILVWGNYASIYFYSKRRSSSRYFYNYPLLMPGYDNQKRFEEFMSDLKADPPAFVMAGKYSEFSHYFNREVVVAFPDFPYEVRIGIISFMSYVEENYPIVEKFKDWIIYRPSD